LYRENIFLAVRIPLASTRVSTHAKKLGEYSLNTWNVQATIGDPQKNNSVTKRRFAGRAV
jgi:hypothetical protein